MPDYDPTRLVQVLDELRQAHNDAVTAGQEARAAILNLISNRIQELIK